MKGLILGSLITASVALSGSFVVAEENLQQKQEQVFVIRETVGQLSISIYSKNKDNLSEELKTFKSYWAESQKDLAETLQSRKMTLEFSMSLDSCGSNNQVAKIIEPYKSEDEAVSWKVICYDKETGAYFIQRRTSKEKMGLKKNAESTTNISVRCECLDKEIRNKAFTETFNRVVDVITECKTENK